MRYFSIDLYININIYFNSYCIYVLYNCDVYIYIYVYWFAVSMY